MKKFNLTAKEVLAYAKRVSNECRKNATDTEHEIALEQMLELDETLPYKIRDGN